MFDTIGFVGGGRVARIMLGGWARSGTALPPVRVFDAAAEPPAGALRSTLEEAAGAELVFLALHPPALAELLPALRAHLRPDAIVCSLASKLRLPALAEALGGFQRLARLNPNAPSIVGRGLNPLACADGLPVEARTRLRALLAPLGECPEVDDPLIETYAVITAMGPTYFWFQFDTLRTQAEAFGLAPEAARAAVARMLHGAVDTLLGGELPPESVMDLVPVRPLSADEPSIRQALVDRTTTAYARLTG